MIKIATNLKMVTILRSINLPTILQTITKSINLRTFPAIIINTEATTNLNNHRIRTITIKTMDITPRTMTAINLQLQNHITKSTHPINTLHQHSNRYNPLRYMHLIIIPQNTMITTESIINHQLHMKLLMIISLLTVRVHMGQQVLFITMIMAINLPMVQMK